MDLTLDNLQMFICHKTLPTNQSTTHTTYTACQKKSISQYPTDIDRFELTDIDI